MFVTERTKESRTFRFGDSTAGDVINYADENQHDSFGSLTRIIGRLGERVTRKATNNVMNSMGKQFVISESIGAATEHCC